MQDFGNQDVHLFVADATKEEECKALVDYTVQKFGRIDILVLSAGVAAHSKFEDLPSMDVFKKIIDTNLFGYVYLTRHALPHIKKTKGQLLVISSFSGAVGMPYRSHYCASKFAVSGFFTALRHELEDQVTVTVVYPPTIKGTKFRENSLMGAAQPVNVENGTVYDLKFIIDEIMTAADTQANNMFMPNKAWFVAYTLPIFPQFYKTTLR